MGVRVCLDCTMSYAADLTNCPHCHSERAEVHDGDPHRGDNMPKITRHGGATIRGEHGPELVAAPDADTAIVTADQLPAEGGETPSPGNSSATSTAKPRRTSATNKTGRRKPARTTASPSQPARTADSSAATTATAGPKTDGN